MALVCCDLVRCSLSARSPQSELNELTPETTASELPTGADEEADEREEVHEAEYDANEADTGSVLAPAWPDET